MSTRFATMVNANLVTGNFIRAHKMPGVIVERVGSEMIAAIGKFLYNFTTALVFRSRGFKLNRTLL